MRGIGIPPRLRRRIFRKFYRIELDDGCGPQGCGLGLAIVDHTMRGHGGFVRVESEPERGSTFSLHFPIPSENAFHGTLAESIR
jgi:signal transduction histidine kinase